MMCFPQGNYKERVANIEDRGEITEEPGERPEAMREKSDRKGRKNIRN